MDLNKLKDKLLNKIERDYRDDVAIVHLYGSFVYGDTNGFSDLDLYFVPKTKRGLDLASTFILDGIGFDLWALPWERLERIASHAEPVSSIITEGEVLFFSTQQDLSRFNELKLRASDTSDKEKFLSHSRRMLDSSFKEYFKARTAGSLSQVRLAAIRMIDSLSQALALLNQSMIIRGRKHLKDELLAMPLIPSGFAGLSDEVFFAKDIQSVQSACEKILDETNCLIDQVLKESLSPGPVAEAFEGWYEEMIQSYNKIFHACRTGDPYTVLFSVLEYSDELDSKLKQCGLPNDFPDMSAAYDPDNLSIMEDTARKHQGSIRGLLKSHGVPVRRIEGDEALDRFLDSL